MPSSHDALGLSGRALPLIRDVVHERLGLYYDVGRYDVLSDRLAPLVIQAGLESFLDYYYLLKYDEHASTEWRRVMDALSVGETYFWREIDQIQAVVDHVVPALLRERPLRPLRIWSVPCATGEEPLTLAMVLEERGWFDRAAIEIHASDASAAAVACAQTGRYRDRAFRALPAALREKYFVPRGENEWTVTPALQRRVASWTVVNLMCEGELEPHAHVPVIFCRNVFIYFSPQAVERVVGQFARAMGRPAFLCLGASESLLKTRTSFELEEIGGSFIYVQRAGLESGAR